MPDTVPTQLDPAVQKVAQDVINDVSLVKTELAALKAGGLSALLPTLPALIAAGQQNYADAVAAFPAFKSGYKTTEFWLIFALFLGNGIYLSVTGHGLPIDVNAVLGGVLAIYAAARALLKANTPTPVPGPVPMPPAAAVK